MSSALKRASKGAGRDKRARSETNSEDSDAFQEVLDAAQRKRSKRELKEKEAEAAYIREKLDRVEQQKASDLKALAAARKKHPVIFKLYIKICNLLRFSLLIEFCADSHR
jgi:hypothetical protein